MALNLRRDRTTEPSRAANGRSHGEPCGLASPVTARCGGACPPDSLKACGPPAARPRPSARRRRSRRRWSPQPRPAATGGRAGRPAGGRRPASPGGGSGGIAPFVAEGQVVVDRHLELSLHVGRRVGLERDHVARGHQHVRAAPWRPGRTRPARRSPCSSSRDHSGRAQERPDLSHNRPARLVPRVRPVEHGPRPAEGDPDPRPAALGHLGPEWAIIDSMSCQLRLAPRPGWRTRRRACRRACPQRFEHRGTRREDPRPTDRIIAMSVYGAGE